MAMMAIKGIYGEYGVQRLNHGIGFDTAAIELLLPTYGERSGSRARSASHWALNPHPTLIPAIESRLGRERALLRLANWAWRTTSRARSDVFFTGADGCLRSNRALCQAAGHYAVRPVHRLDAADRPRRQQLDRDARAASPASAARPTWAPMRAAGATRAQPG